MSHRSRWRVRDIHQDSVSRVLSKRIGSRIVIGDRSNVEFIKVVDIDREDSISRRTVGGRSSDGNVTAGPQRLSVQSGCRGDNTRVGIDRKVATVVIEETVGYRIGCGVGIIGRCRDPNNRANGHILIDRIGRTVRICRGRNGEFIGVDDGD